MFYERDLLEKFKGYCMGENSCVITDENKKYNIIVFTLNNIEIIFNIEKKSAFLITRLGNISQERIFPLCASSILQSGKKGLSIYQDSLYVTVQIEDTSFENSIEKLLSIYERKEEMLICFKKENIKIDTLNREYKII